MIADQAVRDRLLGDFDRTFFVEAGAGTGKTTILVGRIVNLVAAGRVEMDGLAAITFTEAAAAELRDRVREGLERAAEQRPGEERARCLRAVEEIDLAAIQTIHAFAGSLLRSYPLEAGLPPGFVTLDDIEQGLAFEERFRSWFWGAALEPAARETLRRALLLGLTQQHLRELAAALDEQHDLLTPTTTWPAQVPEDAVATAREVGRRLAELAPLVRFALHGGEDPLAQVVTRAQPRAERLRSVASEEQALAELRELESLPTKLGNQKRWGKLGDGRNACAAIKAELSSIKDQVRATLDSHRQAALAGVLQLVRDFVLQGVAERRREGIATFQDLLAWARDLLRNHPDVRRRAQRRYRRIFVDEFQDTDPLQAEIVFYLAADPDQPLPEDWRQIALVPGKLFVVGDPKQSIYRFRRADIAIYDTLLRRLDDAHERLVQNFRSVRPVIDWVNHHFHGPSGGQMAEREGIQPPYVALEASWEAHDGAACGVFRVGADLGPEANAAVVARKEAESLAAVARSLVGTSLVADGARQLRPAEYRDVCILLRSRTHLRTLERALERAEVPYRVESGKLVLATQEVRDLLACLRAIEDPSDQVALVAALRSPAYGCSDVDLLCWVEAGGRLSHEEPGDGPDGLVQQALASLADFHARRRTLSPPALIEAFIRERLLVAAAFDDPRPREAWRRLRYVVSRARQFTVSGRHTLRAFLDWIDGLERAEARDTESAEAEPDEDAVRILTVHGAKGLEFPIVLLGGLGSPPRASNDSIQVIPDRATGALACRIGKEWSTPDFDSAREREDLMAEAEAVRLLYVAGTRARDHLILSLHRGGKSSDRSLAALIEQRLGAREHLCAELVPDPVVRGRATHRPRGTMVTASPGHSSADEQAWITHRAALIRQLSGQALSEIGLDEEDSAVLADDALSEPGSTLRSNLPSRVRRILRRVDADASAGAAADPEASAIARRILNDPIYQRGLADPSCRRDLPILATVDGVLVDTTIDIAYQSGAGATLVVLDSVAPGPPSERWEQRRSLLLRAYQRATGQAVAAVELIPVGSMTGC